MARRLVALIEVESEPGYGWATTRWLRRLTGEGRLAYHKISGRVFVDLGDLDGLVEAGRVEAVTPLKLAALRRNPRRARAS